MKGITSKQLFIYSSLRKGFHDDVFKYITQYFAFVSVAKVKGILSVINNRPVAAPDENCFVKGELYTLKNENNFSWVFGQLDEYEGLDAERDEQNSYRREITTVHNDDGTVTNAWIYWYNGDVSENQIIISGDALEYEKPKKMSKQSILPDSSHPNHSYSNQTFF